MRILNVAQTYFPYLAEGGRPAKVRILSRKLANRGHQVTVLTANFGGADWTRAGVVPEKGPLGWRLVDDGVEAIYLPTLGRYRALTINPRLKSFCAEHLTQFDIVHLYGLYDFLGPAVSYFCRSRQIPYIVEPMGMYRAIDRSVRLKQLWHALMGNAFLRAAAFIVATSEMEHQELLQDGLPPDQVVIRYNGVDSVSIPSNRGSFRSKWNLPSDEPLILFLGRLIPRKGADLLIQAFAQACPQFGRLVIMGPEGERGYRTDLERLARQVGVGGRVIFTGPAYDDEKREVLIDADLFVLPSRYENFANAAAEAMAYGVPVIITEFCGIRSLVSGRAGLVIATEKAALVEALSKLIYDKSLYARFKEGCRHVTAELDWGRLTERMENYYAEAITRGTRVG